MQKCGQLQASMAVALMAQSAAGEAVWPADTPSKAITISNGTLCIRETSFWCGIIRRNGDFRKANRGWSTVAAEGAKLESSCLQQDIEILRMQRPHHGVLPPQLLLKYQLRQRLFQRERSLLAGNGN